MSKNKVPVPAQDVQTLKTYKPLFELGQIVSTPAVLDHLARHAVFPAALLSLHQHGNWGNVDPEDARANDRAVLSGARVVGSHAVAGAVIWIVTAAAGGDGKRADSVLCFLDEY